MSCNTHMLQPGSPGIGRHDISVERRHSVRNLFPTRCLMCQVHFYLRGRPACDIWCRKHVSDSEMLAITVSIRVHSLKQALFDSSYLCQRKNWVASTSHREVERKEANDHTAVASLRNMRCM